MIKSLLSIASILALSLILTGLSKDEYFSLSDDTRVEEMLTQLGEKPQQHQAMLNLDGVSAESGRRLIYEGFISKDAKGKNTKQSAHFVCTSCHNMERDEPDLSKIDAQARLEYSANKGLPMLQGTALYGAVNRSTFYNGDYDRKYGDLVEPARNNIREAIQLCATECAQGRKLTPPELESILAFLWTIDLKASDLNLSETEKAIIENAVNKGKDTEKAVSLIRSKYLSGAPATFVKPPENRKEGYAVQAGDIKNGKLIYESSCLHCHAGQRYSQFNLNNAKVTFDYLEKHFPKYTRYSTYQVTRYGTSPIPGKKAYMPMYPEEKMTNQMVEDLRAYIESEAM